MARPPFSFRDFVGQRQTVEHLIKQLTGAKERGEPFPHTALFGPSGCGKTLLAYVLAATYGTHLHELHGQDDYGQIAVTTAKVEANDFVLVDECHSSTPKSQELLLSIIDKSRLPAWASAPAVPTKALTSSGEETEIPACSIILASDQPGKLANALRRRMALTVTLGFYSAAEMRLIVEHIASKCSLLLSPQAISRLADVSGGLPRRAKQHLESLRRYYHDAEARQLSLEDVRVYLHAAGIDDRGIDVFSRGYLFYLSEVGTASLESLALYLGFGTDLDYVRREVEASLVRKGLLGIGKGGRRLTPDGVAYVDTLRKEIKP